MFLARTIGNTLLAATYMSLAIGMGAWAQQPAKVASSEVAKVEGLTPAPVITMQLHAATSAVTPSAMVPLSWNVTLEDGWHIYWSNPGDSGLPPELSLNGKALPLNFPAPKVISMPPITNYGYEHQVNLHTQFPAPAKEGEHNLTFKASFLYCKDVCLPGQASFTLPLMVNQGGTASANPSYQGPVAIAPLAGATAQILGTHVHLHLPAGLAGTYHFVPAEDGVIDDSAEQTTSNNSLHIKLDNQAQTRPTQLKGLLIGKGEAYTVDIPLPAAGSAVLSPGGTPESSPPTTATGLPSPTPSTGFFFALVSAFLAGMILNLMPCVLPVLSLKVLGLVKHHQGSSRMQHAAAYTGGILVSFWAFAVAIAAVQAGGAQVGWGFHLQSPLFVAGLAVLMVAIALNFFGVYEAGTSLTRLAGAGPHKGLVGSAATGVLAVVVATPCTVPFMGGAMAYALTQSVGASVAIFSAMGLGMALPFLLVGVFPQLGRRLPKPGKWMATFKHAMGWPMLLTALWLAYVFNSLTGQQATFVLLACMVGVSFSVWLYGQKPHAWTALGAVVVAVGTLWAASITAAPSVAGTWQPWSPQAVASAQATNRPIFIDFTADWCITCKVTEATVLNTTTTQALFARTQTHLLKADWTRYNPEITAELARHGRKGVPLYLLYKPGVPEPEILPQLLTPGLLKEKLELSGG